MKLSQAKALAEALVVELAPYCKCIEIAGSIRRGKEEVKDIEIVAIPKINVLYDLFSNPYDAVSAVDGILAEWQDERRIDVGKDGPRQKRLWLISEAIAVDLFLVRPPAQWGVIFALRTGPAEFSKWLATRQPWGALPPGVKMERGALWRNGAIVETPTEKSFFEALGLPWVKPSKRRPKRKP